MPLVLAPSFDDHTREQIETHIAEVQARRMSAAVEYHTGKDAKLAHESSKIQQRIARQYDMLGKELEQLDKVMEKVENRLAGLTHLKNELGMVEEMREMHVLDEEEEENE